MTDRSPREVPTPVRMLGMLKAYWTSQAIHTVAKLQIADLRAHGEKSSEEKELFTIRLTWWKMPREILTYPPANFRADSRLQKVIFSNRFLRAVPPT